MRHIYALLLALLFAGTTHAQTSAVDGLVVNLDGDLWAYNAATDTRTQLTEWGYNGAPHQSPDNTKIAYLSQSEASVNNPEQLFPGTPPTNIWILNRADGSFSRIADQAGEVILRSEPTWSPDSTRLAWSEVSVSENDLNFRGARLVTYDMRNGQTTVLNNNYDLGYQDGGIYMPPVQWGEGGIMRMLFTYREDLNGFAQILELYQPESGSLGQYVLSVQEDFGTDVDFVFHTIWATENGVPRILLFWRDAGWEVFEPSSGVRSPLTAVPRLGIRFGVGEILLTPVFERQGNGRFNWKWLADVQYDGGAPGYTTYIGYDSGRLNDLSLPTVSGSYGIAWRDFEGNVYLWQDGTADNPRIIMSPNDEVGFRVSQPGAAWQSTQWIIDRTVPTPVPPPQAPPTVPPTNCPLPSRLTLGNQVTVTPGTPNNVRSQPATSAQVVGRFRPGVVAQITDGPVCADGIVWWQVNNAGLSGWTAEGANGEYWLTAVANPFPTATAIPAPGCPPPHPSVFEVGELVQVAPGPPNNWRDAPSLNSRVLGVFPAGTQLTILSGPICVDGLNWYQIQFTEGTGWTAEGDGTRYWLQPAG